MVAALVIVSTVTFSCGNTYSISTCTMLVLAMSVLVLLAVGSDYNLLVVSRFKQEMSTRLNTAIIRTIDGISTVVTSADLVFAAIMACMTVSNLRIIGQLSTAIVPGLLLRHLNRSFMLPSTAALPGRWFWRSLRLQQPASRHLIPEPDQPPLS
ncbi:hypothetical protein MUBE_01315 [Mycobacterium uberis]|uniref:Membrane transport protein MMPL domain-containing protein n=1 Tax=Mycobacterium uberis TaxID=2162698 RepID=A0A3E1HLP2_9MYCO|nr:hypothetical protein MUBE_01315 [Mycobacterium uberis]